MKSEKVLIQYIVSKYPLEGTPSYVKYTNGRVSRYASSLSFGYDNIWSVLQPYPNGSFILPITTVHKMGKMMQNKISNVKRKDVLDLCYKWEWYVVVFIKDDVDMYDITNLKPRRQKLIFMR